MNSHSKLNTQFASQQPSLYRDASESQRMGLSAADVLRPKTLPRILLIDDDPTFGQIMERVAKTKKAQLDYCKNIEEFMDLGYWTHDVAIVDYNLGELNGFDFAVFMERYTQKNLPIILVSQTKQTNTKKWPGNIREFVHKKSGAFSIIDAAFEAHEVEKLNQEIFQRNHEALENLLSKRKIYGN